MCNFVVVKSSRDKNSPVHYIITANDKIPVTEGKKCINHCMLPFIFSAGDIKTS